jgi:hypothetical protein
VCKTFECLLLQIHPRLFMHLVNIGAQPLKVRPCSLKVMPNSCMFTESVICV